MDFREGPKSYYKRNSVSGESKGTGSISYDQGSEPGCAGLSKINF